ncbi:MAG: ATP-binding cassette domain-containing protein [Candidatus Limnocylindrus sp.]
MPDSPMAPAARSLPEIEIANLVWRPAGAAAPTLDLRGFSLHIRSGETLLISGASGAGKSTLAAACAGLLGTLVPGELQGTLRVGGHDLVAAATAREPGPPATLLEQIGVVLAGPAPRHALPRLTDDLALPLESRGVPAALIGAKVRAATSAVGLPDDAVERDVERLSGGERAQAAIATALISEPALLIADEPLAGLDESRAAVCAAQIATLRATRVLVAHDLEPFAFATQRVHLSGGRVVPPPTAPRTGSIGESTPLVGVPTESVESVPARDGVVLQLFAASSHDRPNVPPLSITLHAGELTLLSGATGSGKSTLLALAAGVLPLDAGERHVSEKVNRSDQVIRYVPQDPGLLLGARSLAQMLAPGEVARAETLATDLGVADLVGRPASRCSDGERRRLALVLAASQRPTILLVDEPTLGLDDASAVGVISLLVSQARAGCAILVATHDERLARVASLDFVRTLSHPSGTSGATEGGERSVIYRDVQLASDLLSPPPVKRLIGVSNPLTRFGLAIFWFLLSVISPATAIAQGAIALPALIVAWSSGVQLLATLRLGLALAPAIAGLVIANVIGGASLEAAFGAGLRLVAFAAGSLVLLRPFEPLRLADGAIQHLRAPFAPTLTLLASAATLPSLMREARERRAIRRLSRRTSDPLLLADLFDAAIRAVPRLAAALEVRGVRLPSRARPASASRPSTFGRADLLLVVLSAGGLAVSIARALIERLTLGG